MAEIVPRLIVVSDRPTKLTIRRRTGDTAPENFQLIDVGMTAIDVTGRTFRLAADPSQTPANTDNQIYELTGEIVDAETGKIRFPLSAGNAAAAAGSYFFDVEMTYDEDDDATGVIKTIASGRWVLTQDITQ